MNLDVNQIITDVLSVIKVTVVNNHNKLELVARQFLMQNKDMLELMLQLRVSGELNDEDFKDRMNDQKLLLEAQFNALQVISKVIAQQTANAVIDVLEKAITAAVRIR